MTEKMVKKKNMVPKGAHVNFHERERARMTPCGWTRLIGLVAATAALLQRRKIRATPRT
jgi:hypothetical protein